MPSRNAPGLGLRIGYDIGEDGWGPGYTEDMRLLSAVAQPVVYSFVAELPDSPTDGDRHILSAEDSNSGAIGSIIIRDNGEWVYVMPSEGWEVWNIGDGNKYRYIGGAWGVIPGSGSLNATGIAYDAGEDGDSNSTETNVGDALDDLYARLRTLAPGGSLDASGVSYNSGDEGDSNSEDTTVQEALDELFSRLRVLDPAFFFVGGTGDANRRVTYVASRPFRLPINLTGSQSWAETPTTDDSNSAAVVFDIQKNGASIGSATFDGGSQTCTFTFASAQTFAAGDRLGIVAPASLGALLGISITLMGERIG